VGIVAGVLDLAAGGEAVERRLGEVEVAALDQLGMASSLLARSLSAEAEAAFRSGGSWRQGPLS
jgi:hypothetical protein